MAIKSADQVTLLDITDGYSVILSMESIALTAGATNKLNTAKTAAIAITVLRGDEQITPSAVTLGTLPSNVTATVGTLGLTTPVNVTFGANLAAGGSFDIVVTADDVTITKTFSYSLAFKGAMGTAAYVYNLLVSPAAVVKAENGTLSPASITVSATRGQGTETPAEYFGRFKIEYSSDGSTWTDGYISQSRDESSKSYTVPAAAKLLRCSLYLAGGTSTLLDTQTVPIVSDGPTGQTGQTGGTGPAGADAYTVILTNESHTFPAGITAAIASNTEVGIIAYKGATQVAATIGTISGTVTGLTATPSGSGTTSAKVTVAATTSLTTKSGTLTIPVTVDGHTFTKKFTWALSLTGATGAQGPQGDAGEDAITLVITSSQGFIFKNASIVTTLTAHVFRAGTELSSSEISALGAVKWYKDGDSTAVATGLTLAISAGDVTNKATYTAQLEG